MNNLFNPTDEHKLLRNTIFEFTKNEIEPLALEYDRKEEFNLPMFRKLGELGLLGITVPEQYGGSGMDATSAVIAHEELSTSDPGFCLAYLAHSMLCANNISVNANHEQKEKFLPKLCSGEWVGAMAMSEPDMGTDVLAMKTNCTEKDNGFVINGTKMWITNGCIDENKTPADCVLIYATSQQKKEISTFVVQKDMSGYYVGQKIKDKLGMRSSNTAELVFDNCLVPKANMIGVKGDSITHMMRNLEIERMTLAAQAVGIARRCINVMNKYASERKSFGKEIRSFGQIQKYISQSYSEYMAAKTYLYSTASKLDLNSKQNNRLDSDGVKLFATNVAKKIADRSIQVLGGYGYVGEYVVERLWRDAKLLEIGGGTLEAHQKNITKDLDGKILE